MSRVANKPIEIPKGVQVSHSEQGVVTVKGTQGEISWELPELVRIDTQDDAITIVYNQQDDESRALAGTTRALVANMVVGASVGFTKGLTIVGVGYRGRVEGKKINLSLGFSHPVIYDIPEGVSAEMPSQTEIVLKSIDKQKVGQVAAEIRAIRPPEPYQGKGVRYSDEQVRRKQSKKTG